jgi:tetratricopeptide (TPR) repeat protein
MSADDAFQTETMARIYESQGHFDRAAAIYRRLLARDPGRGDLAARLAALEERAQSHGEQGLAQLVGEWVDLLARTRKVRALDAIRRRRKL